MEYPNYQGIPQGIGVHQKVWGKMFLIYLIKKLLRSIGQLKMILKKNKSGCPTLFDALLICRLIICFWVDFIYRIWVWVFRVADKVRVLLQLGN